MHDPRDGRKNDDHAMMSDAIVIAFGLAVIAGMIGLYIQWYRAGHRDRFLPW